MERLFYECKSKNRDPISKRESLPIQVGGFPIVIRTASFYSYDNPLDKEIEQ